MLQTIHEIKTLTNKNEDPNTAAPGAVKPQVQDVPFRGDIEITVGPTNQNYNSFIEVRA